LAPALARPRSEKRPKPRHSLIWPKTGSASTLRRAWMRRSDLLDSRRNALTVAKGASPRRAPGRQRLRRLRARPCARRTPRRSTRVEQQRGHHARRVGTDAASVLALDGVVDGRHVQLSHQVEHKVGVVAFGQPLHGRRRQEKVLLPGPRPIFLGHARNRLDLVAPVHPGATPAVGSSCEARFAEGDSGGGLQHAVLEGAGGPLVTVTTERRRTLPARAMSYGLLDRPWQAVSSLSAP
jgi:hypothetical protein